MRKISGVRAIARAAVAKRHSESVISAPVTKESLRGVAAFTLAEVVVCLAIVALLFGGIITGYMQGAYRAEWAGYNLAAQAQALQQLEQAKAAMWDNSHNEFTNILLKTWATSPPWLAQAAAAPAPGR